MPPQTDVSATRAPASLACPADRTALGKTSGDALGCPSCGRAFPIREGVVNFLSQADDFYEAHYADWVPIKLVPRSESWFHSWPLWLIKSGFVWSVRKHVPAGGTVIEVGCGGGIAYFGKRYRMVGIDVAHSGLVKLVDLYEACLQTDIAEPLPLPDGSADAVVNSFVWEHIRPETKPGVLAEWARVLKPGGKIILLYDVETNNPLIRRLKRSDGALYRKLYIENEHHFGYQSPEENRALFESAGFQVLEHAGKEKTWIQSPWEYDKIGKWGGWPAKLSGIGLRLSRQPYLYPYTGLVRFVDDIIGPMLPMSWSRTVLSVCRKP